MLLWSLALSLSIEIYPTSKKTPQPNPIEAFFTMKFKFHPYSATTIHFAPFPSLLNKVTT